MSAERTPVSFSYPEKGSRVLREWNEKRQAERAIVARHAEPRRRAFAAAAINRLTASLEQWSGAINADLDGSLAVLRARARNLCANNEFGRRFLALVSANVVGPAGPTLQVRSATGSGKLDKRTNDAIEMAWSRWARQADITGRMSLARLLQVAMKGVARDGEALLRKVRGNSLPFGIQLQLLEADRLDEALNITSPFGLTIRQGVELDSAGRPVAYHLLTTHPGDNFGGQRKTERVLARDILHIYLPERAEQVRGYSWLHAVLLRSHMLHGFEEAAVVAARVGAAKMGVFKRSADASDVSLEQIADGKSATGALQVTAEPGEFVELPMGYELQSWDPEYPHANFEAFVKTCARGIAAGLNVAAHNLSGDMTDVNYSSARIAEQAEREVWKELQEWLIASVMLPLFEDWLGAAAFAGELRRPSGVPLDPVAFAEKLPKIVASSRFQGRRWDWVDPLKDGQANELLVSNGLISRTQIAASQGREFEDIVDELAQEQALLAERGITLGSSAAAGAKPKDLVNTESEGEQ